MLRVSPNALKILLFLQFLRVTVTFMYGSSSRSGIDIDGRCGLYSSCSRQLATNLDATRKKKIAPSGPEFSRVLNVAQIPGRRPVLCKLLAKDKERIGLAERFDIPELTYFAANVTVARQDPGTIVVKGTIEARMKGGDIMPLEVITSDFDTMILDNTASPTGLSLDEAMDYDDEVDKDGNIDLGEIAAQYLSLELF